MRYKMVNILIKSLFRHCTKNFYESFQQKKEPALFFQEEKQALFS